MTRKKKPFSHSAKASRRNDLARSTGAKTSSPIHARIRAVIRQIPRGKVSTYGAVARAAGFPGAARQVARALHSSVGLPWQRVLGSGGEIKLRGHSALEQRFRLEAEGVRFRGKKVDMKAHEFQFPKRKTRYIRLKILD
jgi:methylated-DNA-protein-cysteine methyltransferase-like protein